MKKILVGLTLCSVLLIGCDSKSNPKPATPKNIQSVVDLNSNTATMYLLDDASKKFKEWQFETQSLVTGFKYDLQYTNKNTVLVTLTWKNGVENNTSKVSQWEYEYTIRELEEVIPR